MVELELIYPSPTCYPMWHMEREPPEVARRLMRAARSLNYNRELQPLVEERIQRAEGTLRGFLIARGLTALRLGAFQVEMGEDGAIDIERVALDGNWRQMPLSDRGLERQPEVASAHGNDGDSPARTVRPYIPANDA